MTFGEILYTIFIGPLQLIFEIIYSLSYRIIGHPGLAIVSLSLVMNFLILPLYKRSDAMQEEARDMEERLKSGVDHIKKTFSGDERMMILQTYYRQNHYKPTNSLQGSVSLLLEIPFFMAAYQFLSHVSVLRGASLGPIENLGAPDALITVGTFTINMLPILMTFINVISSAIYLKGFSLKTKIQLYGIAIFFLFFLYNSPSGLVFYWILNNVFSLVKNIVYRVHAKIRSSRKLEIEDGNDTNGKLILDGNSSKRNDFKGKQFFLSSFIPVILIGILIPATIIEDSTIEFMQYNFYNPMWYIGYSLCLAVGMFLVWLRVFYWLAKEEGKILFERILWIVNGILIVNYMFFGSGLGFISVELKYENGVFFEISKIVINIFVLLLVSIVLYVVIRKWKTAVGTVCLTVLIALAGLSGYKMWNIHDAIEDAENKMGKVEGENPEFILSQEGKNVVVLVLDRALGHLVPYLFDEKPELKEKFDGFTYYSNVISYGAFTNFGIPPVYGGYEYTPIEMNKRDEEKLVEKHNEALKVMPVMFMNQDYEVTVCDPPYANYSWFTDLSIYDEYPEIDAYITDGRFGNPEDENYKIPKIKRNFFCFSIMKTMPLFMQSVLYDGGNYHHVESETEGEYRTGQRVESVFKAEGTDSDFMEAYSVLLNLPNITTISEGSENTFLMLMNNTTHAPALLSEPEYIPAEEVDNTKYYNEKTDRFVYDGRELVMEDYQQIVHYQINMASLLQVGNWLDYMRENQVYDNTRIIIVSDHGRDLYQLNDLIISSEDDNKDTVEFYYPLLMVKDFHSEGFEVSDEFMTNADVPTLAIEGLLVNSYNPFTGKEINNDEKNAHEQYITRSLKWGVDNNNGNTFIPSKWYAVRDNIWDINNWRAIDEEGVLPRELVGE